MMDHVDHTKCDPLNCPEKWYNDLGPGRGKPEKPLHEVVRGLLRFSAPQWMIDRLAGRAEKLHKEIDELKFEVRKWADFNMVDGASHKEDLLKVLNGPRSSTG